MSAKRKLFATGLFAVLCSGCDDDAQPCTFDARGSLGLTIVDADTGDPVNAAVEYLVDGEMPNASAERTGAGQFWLGLEVEGLFEVTVSADDYETVMREFEIESDGCHVITMQATIELTKSP